MSRELSAAYGRTGRPSIPPERLIKAMPLMASMASAVNAIFTSGSNAACYFSSYRIRGPQKRLHTRGIPHRGRAHQRSALP